jgi:hypothetical protein
MTKEAVELGDIRINEETNKVEICTEIVYEKDGIVLHWEDYDTSLLQTTLGQCGHTNDVYNLLYFRENFEKWLKEQLPKDTIKIRYAYLGSPTNLQTDPAYHETPKFKVLTIAELELRPNRIDFEELITDGEEAMIKILGRDRCTGRVDMAGNDIYENDRIRWYADSGGYIDEIVDQKTRWISTFCTKDCKVIGTIYDKKGNR